jgi:hypothetical protein
LGEAVRVVRIFCSALLKKAAEHLPTL